MNVRGLQSWMRQRPLDAVVLVSRHSVDPNIAYFSDVDSGKCCLYIPKRGTPTLYVSGFELTRLAKQARGVRLVGAKRPFTALQKRLKSVKRIGINEEYLSVLDKKGLGKQRYADVSGKLDELRLVKSEEEIRRIKRACRLTQSIFGELIDNIYEHKTEIGAARFLKARIFESGVQESFEPIVAVGRNASMPHHAPGKTMLKRGFCLVDFGVRYKNYCSDMTRTFYIGKPNSQEKRIYDLVKNTQINAVAMCKPDEQASRIVESARENLGKYRDKFTHGLGHSVGVSTHDSRFGLTEDNPGKLKKNMVMTVEPGVYLGGFGIRIEDVILVDRTPKVFYNFTRELVTV